ncbi:MAG TPA: S9 family peptidase [Bacteroidia bacterium]|nr:S9 family peptidase [Bacteroidia bacterium]
MKPGNLLLCVSLLTFQSVYSQDVMKPETLWSLQRVAEPRLSPDGKTVVYSVKAYDIRENKGNNDLWVVPANGGSPAPVAAGPLNDNSARWRPDGKKILYLSNQSGSMQIWEMDPDGSNKLQVTQETGDISAYGMSADGSRIWFAKEVKTKKDLHDLYPDLPKADAMIYDDLMYRHWDEWEDANSSHIFTAAYANGKLAAPTDIMLGEDFDAPMKPFGGDEQIAISPDGKKIAYSCKKMSGREYAVSTNSEIYVYDTEKATTENISKGMEGYDMNPAFSPDGKSIIWLSMKTPGYEADRNRIMLMDLNTKTTTELTTGFDYTPSAIAWSPGGKLIYFIAGINATEQLWSLNPDPKADVKIHQLTMDVVDYTDFSVARIKKEDVMVAARMSISAPTEIYHIDLKGNANKQITFTNGVALSKIKLGKVEKRMVKATDGKEILTWVIYPPNFDPSKKYPAILYCQGGPQSTVSQFFSYRWNFQMMAANGYIVVAPNRRGLPSFGEQWNLEISGDWGGQAMRDLLSAIDDVSKEPYVDASHMAAVGASFGGYSVYWLEGHHEKRFKAFIAHCGVFNLESMYGSTEEVWFPDFDLGGPYWKNPMPKSYRDFSPSNFVQNWDTPILVIHNGHDFRVPITQGMEAFNSARLMNIPARFLSFPEESHWVLKPQNGILWQREFFSWLDKYCK